MNKQHETLSIRRQCLLLGLNRSRNYYKVKNNQAGDGDIINEIIEIFLGHPIYGYRRIHAVLKRKGYSINRKKVARLMKQSGLQAIYQKRKTSIANKAHKKYPYLLKGAIITRPNQAWCVDITYIKLKGGFVYLVALIDMYSRMIVGWCLSTFMSTNFCLDAIQSGLQQFGRPDLINSDQGCQFTSEEWIDLLQKNSIKISMDGKGRYADNILIERFWRTIKYEEVYLHSYDSVDHARDKIGNYINFYNLERPHQKLGYKTPIEVFMKR